MKRSHQKSPRCGHQVESDRVPPVIKMLVLGNEKTSDVRRDRDRRTDDFSCEHRGTGGVEALGGSIDEQCTRRTQFDFCKKLVFLRLAVIPDREEHHHCDQHRSVIKPPHECDYNRRKECECDDTTKSSHARTGVDDIQRGRAFTLRRVYF
jgi:hypothetical protein